MMDISLTEKQFSLTDTIRQTEIRALIDGWVTNTLSVKILCPQINCSFLHFRKHNAWLFVYYGFVKFMYTFL
jgi:hypothetical protein